MSTDSDVGDTGRTSSIFHVWIPEDAELPEYKDPKPGYEEEIDRHNREYNDRARAMPTSIQSQSDYFVARGQRPDVVRIVVVHKRVDPGYKTPRIEFPDLGDEEQNIQLIAEHLADIFTRRRDRSESEKALEMGRRLLNETLLTHEVREIVLDPELIAQNQLDILQNDMMTGLSNTVQVDFSDTSTVTHDVQSFLSSVEFNFLSEMQQRQFSPDIPSETKAEMKAIVDNFLGK